MKAGLQLYPVPRHEIASAFLVCCGDYLVLREFLVVVGNQNWMGLEFQYYSGTEPKYRQYAMITQAQTPS